MFGTIGRWLRERRRVGRVRKGGVVETRVAGLQLRTEADAYSTLRRLQQIRDVEAYAIYRQDNPAEVDWPWRLSITYCADFGNKPL